MEPVLQLFVSIDDAAHEPWRFQADGFLAQLRSKWPDAIIREITRARSPYSHDWKRSADGWQLTGMLDRAGVDIAFEAPPALAAVFTDWIRSIVPTDVRLVFYDIAGEVELSLSSDVSFDEILAVLK